MVSREARGVIGPTTRPRRFVRSRTIPRGLREHLCFLFVLLVFTKEAGDHLSFVCFSKIVKELGVQDPVGFWDPAGEGLCLRHCLW